MDDDPADPGREEEEGVGDPLENRSMMKGESFRRLNRAVAGLIDSFSMVSYLKLDVQDEDSVGGILSYIDDAIQYHEAQEPREMGDTAEIEYEDGDGFME